MSGPAFRRSTLGAHVALVPAQARPGLSASPNTPLPSAARRAPVSRELLFQRLGRRRVYAVLVRGDKLYAVETETAPKDTASLMRICAMAELVGRKLGLAPRAQNRLGLMSKNSFSAKGSPFEVTTDSVPGGRGSYDAPKSIGVWVSDGFGPTTATSLAARSLA